MKKVKEQKRRIRVARKWRKLERHLMRGVLLGHNFSYDLETKTLRTFRFEGEYDWTEKPHGRSYGVYVYKDEKLTPIVPPIYPKRLGKNRRRNTNGGWRYGSYNRKDFRAGKRQFVAGKSSREFQRERNAWYENESH